jgi:NAD(P)-dependent dehydrogenase (short-subunit alcohol dehydrogenase family)
MSLLSQPFDPARDAALVTGAGNGIGRAIAQALVGEGVRTVFADISEDRVTAAIEASARPELAVPFVGDLAGPAVREALLKHARSALGRVTHFVHSASPPRRETDHPPWRSALKPGRRCMQSISRPAFTSRANWHVILSPPKSPAPSCC